MTNKPAVSISYFYKVYAIPKRNIQLDFPVWINSDVMMETVKSLYQEIVTSNPNKRLLEDVALVGCNRLFDARTGLSLSIGKQIENVMVRNIEASLGFTTDLFKNRVNCLQLQGFIDGNHLDYFDLSESMYLKMDHHAYYYLSPMVAISTNPSIIPGNVILESIKNQLVYEKLTMALSKTPMCDLIKKITLGDHFFVGLVESEISASKFLVESKKLVYNLTEIK